MPGALLPLQSGLDAVVSRYAEHGPLAAAFLANLLATFGDKGQLVVITLATRYDAKAVFFGAMGAFTVWSALEVAFGQYVVAILPAGVVTMVAGGLFLLFGLWTARSAVKGLRNGERSGAVAVGAGLDVGLSGWLIPDALLARAGRYSGLLTGFLFVLFAEFGDKTQLLTINLAATFPDAPVSVFVGVLGALALRTGVDAVVGGKVEAVLPTAYIEAGAAVVFLAFGLVVLGAPATVLYVAIAALIVAAGVGLARRR
ncbi:TMEM165/GDT1 family protein [Halolamina salifodinae]|uniref:Putative Ca2+/H+ antiporter (TMEM165/GDT1 family) n=1 Tax=Halolamina salifodinae TaxID=1202767 RepID=A0A8T4H002_9EURY|nr:TMEM165/GDT1 family protein [Halolamina salifodinae]MBP1986925.1 putative Ca2+/H+ antiporter (TMEM165/GDT1 family) [Halolamina salifodinae]